MGIVLFAILGAWVKAPAGFWITYGILTGLNLITTVWKAAKKA